MNLWRSLPRNQGDTWLLGLYGLALLLGFIYLLLLGMTTQFLWNRLLMRELPQAFLLAFNTLVPVVISVGLALPFAGAFSFLLLSSQAERWSLGLQNLLRFQMEWPLLFYGLWLLSYGQGSYLSCIIVFFTIAVVRLTERWVKLLKSVSSSTVDVAKGMGMTVFDIVFWVYLRRFWSNIVFHIAALCCFMMTLVMPFLVLIFYSGQSKKLMAVHLFFHWQEDPDLSYALFFVLLLFHALRVVFDSFAEFKEVDNV